MAFTFFEDDRSPLVIYFPRMERFLYPMGSFVAGFLLMGFEILASRIIAPLIGNSLYSWASVISVILLGLSLGAYMGGKQADKGAPQKILVVALFLSSLCISLVPFFSLFLQAIPPFLSIATLSLFYATILFFPASFLLGTLQPLLLKLYSSSLQKLGEDYGIISMLWSIGSILGALSMGFVFISLFGTTSILFALAIICICYGALILSKAKLGKAFGIMAGISFACTLLMFALYGILHKHMLGTSTVFEKDTSYYHLRVIDFSSPEFGFSRSLFLDYDAHSVEQQHFVPYMYTDVYPIFSVLSSRIKNILVIGAGAYTLPKNISSYYHTPVSVLEIDKEIPPIAKQYFGYNENDIHTDIGEARTFLRQGSSTYDLIFGDAYNSFISLPWHLTTEEYYLLTKKRLRTGGIYAMSFIGSEKETSQEFLSSMVKTFTAVYPNSYILRFTKDKDQVGNIVFIGINAPKQEHISEDEIRKRFKNQGNFSFLAYTILSQDEVSHIKNNKKATLFTDNYAPVESMMAPLMASYFKEYGLFVSYISSHKTNFSGEVINNTLIFKLEE